MRLRRLAIREFRKLHGPIVLEGLSDGLNLIAGDNEEGKSTVLAALKAAFFEHHTVGGAAGAAMLPHGGGTPEIEVGFELGGQLWRLRKQFKRGKAELEGPGGRLNGDAAEDRLRDLLRFERRRGHGAEQRPEQLGLTGLFWLDQGTTFVVAKKPDEDPLAIGRDRFAAAIAGELGAVTGGEKVGRLLQHARARCNRFWTPTWKETGAVKEARDTLAHLEAEVVEARAKAREQEDQVDRLARLRGDRDRARTEDRVGRARASLAEAQRRLDGLDALERDLTRVTDRLNAETSELERLRAADQERRRLREDAATAAATADGLGRDRAELDQGLEQKLAAVAAAEAEERAAAAASAAACSAHDRLARRLERHVRRRELAALEARADAVRGASEVARAARAEIAANPATAARLKTANDAERDRQTAQAALDAVATSLEVHLEPGRTVTLDGHDLVNGRPVRLTERSEIVLRDVGRLVIVPGGGEMASRRSAVRAAAARRDEALATLGVGDLATAERLAEERRTAETAASRADTQREARLAAAGLPSLEAIEDRIAAARAACASRGDAEDDAGHDGEEGDLPRQLEVATRAVEQATIRLDAARAEMRVRDQQATQARQEQALLEHKQAAAQAEIRRATARLQALAADLNDQALSEAFAAAGERRLGLLGERDALLRDRERVDPEQTRERRDQAQRALSEIERERDRLDRDIVVTESELRVVGDEGRGERLAEIELRHGAASSELAGVELEARAWRLVHEELTRAAAEMRGAYLTPVVDRLRPWLARLWPDAEPHLDPTSLAPIGLRRGGEPEPLGTLSVGTREQLAVLVRLGLAQLLLEREGEAPCIVLDDALVYADETRFETMKLILKRASRATQILILTCRPRDYAGLAEQSFRLEDCRALA